MSEWRLPPGTYARCSDCSQELLGNVHDCRGRMAVPLGMLERLQKVAKMALIYCTRTDPSAATLGRLERALEKLQPGDIE